MKSEKEESYEGLRVPDSWAMRMRDYLESRVYKRLMRNVMECYETELVVPAPSEVFRALELVSPEDAKVVIFGQDPYYNRGQAMGLSFSVNEECAIPPSLQNIFKEVSSDLGITCRDSGDLTRWAEQGVLLLNSCLTTKLGVPGVHTSIGWVSFREEVVRVLNESDKPIVFMLWGSLADNVGCAVTNQKHLVLTAGHPSPRSCEAFFGCKHFSRCNEFLIQHGRGSINWR